VIGRENTTLSDVRDTIQIKGKHVDKKCDENLDKAENADSVEYHLLTLGKADRAIVGEHVKVTEYKSEHGLLIGFSKLIKESRS